MAMGTSWAAGSWAAGSWADGSWEDLTTLTWKALAFVDDITASIVDSIVNGDTTHSPSGDIVFEELLLRVRTFTYFT